MKSKHLAVAAAAALAALLPAALASGQEAAPAPGCQGIQLVDKKGDNSQPSTDILGVFYTTTGGKTFANLQLSDIKPELPEGSTQWFWYVDYEVGEALYRLQAFYKPDGSSGFKARELHRLPENDVTRGFFTDVGTLNGKIFMGKNGIVQWELTEEIGAAAGAKFFNHFAATDEVVAGEPFMGTGYLRVVASIDDTTDVKSTEYTVRECAAGETAPASADPAPTTPPAGTPPSQTTPGTGNAPPPQSGQPATPAPATRALDVAVSRKVPRARKVRRSLKLNVSSKNGVSGIEAILRTRGKKAKTIARGKLSKLKGKGRLTLRVSKKIKKGTYTLQIAGRNADGSAGTRSFKLKFK